MSWQICGASLRGAQHQRLGLPVQDALARRPLAGGAILAVADGHGSPACLRSDIGAQLAVAIATDLLIELASNGPLTAPREMLAHALVYRWREAVHSHAAAHPLVPGSRPLTPESYGTTLLAVLATEQHLLTLQLGDGDILLVSSTGHTRRPWPRDPRLLGGETTSLCLPEAARELRMALYPLDEHAPQLIFLCTDGYSNSFRTERGFLRVGRDILSMVRAHGIQQVERDLAVWLEEASRLGSGDDVTAGLLYRVPGDTA